MLKFSESDPFFFELILGSEDGQIFHGAIQIDKESGRPQMLEPFKSVVQTPEYSAILDLKVTQVKDTFLVLAASATKLY